MEKKNNNLEDENYKFKLKKQKGKKCLERDVKWLHGDFIKLRKKLENILYCLKFVILWIYFFH